MGSRRLLRRIGYLGIALVLSLAGSGTASAAGALGSTARAASPATPNRFDPTSRAASAKPAPAARSATSGGRRMPGSRQRPAPGPVTVALDPSRPVQVTSGDRALELDVPAGAVSAVDVSAAGGSMSLLVRQVVPASGGSGGGSGVVTFGTFLVQVLDTKGHLARQGLRQPLGVKLHVPGRAGALDLSHAVAVVNAPLPPGVSLDPAATPQPAGPASGRASATTSGTASPNHGGLGRMTRTPAMVDPMAGTLSTSAAASGSSTTVSFATVAPVATFGAPDLAEVSLNAGDLRLQDPLDLPAGPGGLTPSLKLSYNSAMVSDQHDVAAAAPWAGEGWHLSLGGISWAERNITQGCSTVCAGFTWGDTWQLVDAFGTKAELIPPNDTTSTYYEDFNGTSISPSPITWLTTPDAHVRVISYVGPNSLPGMGANPPCFRVFLPSGIMEEFGCTPDSVQFYPQPSGPNTGLDYIANWLPDLITDPVGNQIHVTYQTDTETGTNGIAYPRDSVMATVEYDSPGCLNAQAACTGSAWAPLMRVSFQASHSVAHVAGSSCSANGTLRCDDPVDLSGSGGLAAPLVENTFVLNDVQVQVRGGGTAAWNTLRDYRLSYDQSGPTTITDPFSGVAQSTAGRLNLTQLTEIGADGSTALPTRSFAYSRQTLYYEDSAWAPAPAGNCGPSWNAGQTFGQGCNLWSQSYEGNSYYLSSVSNGLGLTQTFGWQDARNNTDGVPSGQELLDPFICNSMQSTSPCDVTDDESWSRMVLTQRTDGLVRLSQAGQGGAQTSTPVTGTYSYGYRMAAADSYWGDATDWDVTDFYNWRFMGFATATVTNPDGSTEVHQYPGTLGRGVFDPGNAQFANICTSSNPCNASPWWNPANAEHGREIEVDRSNPGGALVRVTKTQYQATCPSTGVTGDFAGNLVSEMDWGNMTALCDVQPSQVDEYFVDGGSQSAAPHLITTLAHDAYGRVTSATETSNDGGASPTTIVAKPAYVWNDAVSATGTSATGTYLIDLRAFTDVEDSSGNRYRCDYTSFDGQANTTGQSGNLRLGEPTRTDVYTSCGTSANNFTPSGQISTTRTFDGFGNQLTADDADAVAGIASHTGCSASGGTFTICSTYDGTFGVLPTSGVNALNQRISLGYQAPTSGTATGGFGLWPTSTTDANGQTTTFAYDALGRPTSETLPGEGSGLTTNAATYTVWCPGTAAQAPCAEIDRTQRLNGSTTVTARAFYDGLGHLVETRSPAPGGQDVVQYSFFDSSQRLAFRSVPYLVAAYTGGPGANAYSIPDSSQPGTTHTYDGLGRTTSTTDPFSHRTTTTYAMACGAAGTGDSACYKQTLTVDANGHQVGALVDALGRTDYEQRYTGSSSSTYAVYATGKYSYNFVGQLVQVLQQDGHTTTTIQYDMAGRRTSMSDPDLGSRSFSYDPNGNLVQSVDARGAAGTVFIGYDGLNRPLWHNTQNSASGAYYTYSYDSTASGNQGVGQLTGETFTNGSLSGSYGFTYDTRGRMTGQAMTVAGSSLPTSATYDDAGNPLTLTYPDGEVVTNAYTAQGYLSGVSTRQGSATTTLLSGGSYSGVGGAFGEMTGASLGGGTYTFSATDDLLGRATDLKVTGSGGTTLFDQARTFDGAGNVSTANTQIGSATDRQAFCYDEQNRLTWAGSTGTPPCTGQAISAGTLTAAQYTQSLNYDNMGRLTTGPLGSYTYGDAAHVHAATAVGTGYTARYDAAGDMTCRAPTGSTTCSGSSPNGAQLAYDNEGQLVSWQGGGVTDQMLYDCQGLRVAQRVTQGGTTTTTVYVGGLEAVTTSGSTTTTRTYYTAGGSRIAMAVNGTFSYLASDGLASATVALNGSGSATASQLFAPLGTVRYASGGMPTDYGFTGQRTDATIGLVYLGARYYDPAAGQFARADTATPGRGYDLWGLSRYAYTRGNPTSRTDPTGHDDFGGGFDTGGFDTGSFDTGSFDTGSFDTGGFDTSSFDTGSFDTSSFDTSSFDTSSFDTSSFDTSSFDTSSIDTGSVDTGSADTGSVDTGSADTSTADTGLADTGTTDTGTTDTNGIDNSTTDPNSTDTRTTDTTTTDTNANNQSTDAKAPADQPIQVAQQNQQNQQFFENDHSQPPASGDKVTNAFNAGRMIASGFVVGAAGAAAITAGIGLGLTLGGVALVGLGLVAGVAAGFLFIQGIRGIAGM